jgi:transposase-like protein
MQASVSPVVLIRHSAEFKTRVVKACERPGASIAATALTNGVNANLVHRWIRERRSGVIWADGNVRNYVLHSGEYKRAIVAQCQRAGVSITGVAYSHGLCPALVHKWIEAERRTASLSRFAPSPTEDWLSVVVSEEIATQGTQSRSRPALPAVAEAVPIVLEISGARLEVPVDSENFLDTFRVILEHLK